MNRSSHLFKRGASFCFRRRLPGTRAFIIQIPLGSSHMEAAARLANHMSEEFDLMLERYSMNEDYLPDEVMAKFFDMCLRKLLEDLKRRTTRYKMSGYALPKTRRTTEITRKVHSFLIEDGITDNLPAHRYSDFPDRDDLEDAVQIHRWEVELIRLKSDTRRYRDVADQTIWANIDPNNVTPLLKINSEAQMREKFMLAHIAATRAFEDQPAGVAALAEARARDILDDQARSQMGHATVLHPAPAVYVQPSVAVSGPLLTQGVEIITKPLTHELLDTQFEAAARSGEALNRSPVTDPFSIDIAGVCERSIRRAMKDGKMKIKTAFQRRSDVKLFCFITGLQLITDVEQYHIQVFVDAVQGMPDGFLKSPSHKFWTFDETTVRAKSLPAEKLGRAPGTVNRYLDNIGAIITYARTQDGIAINPAISTTGLRLVETVRARSKRSPFKLDDVRALFQHPIWQGCRRFNRRQDPGDLVLKDALYWIPLIVSYTGARAEEIAGLPAADVVDTDDGYGLDIYPHAERGLKTLQSTRLLPVHEHLVELGLIAHRDKMLKDGRKYLFPELKPKAVGIDEVTGFPARPSAPFSKPIKYNWTHALLRQLDDNPRELDMHSLRHYVNITLKNAPGIDRMTRLDILGHGAPSLNEEVYEDEEGTPFPIKMAAINSIPRAF